MQKPIFLFFSQYRLFWKFRSIIDRIYFWIGAQIFRSRYFVKEKKDNFGELRHLFEVTQIQLLLALLCAALLQWIDPIAHDFYKLTLLKIPNDSDYVTFLATISGIGAVFIGLYYTAISTIGGSIYSKVPNNIRDLLAHERVGNVYMNFLSFVTFLGVILVSFRVLGFEKIYVAIPIMLVAAGIGIIAFVKLGQRAFYLFDPTALSHHLFGQLRLYIKMVCAGGFRWKDANFQNHSNKLASSSLDTLETLAEITKNESHLSGAPFISLSKNLLSFLIFYEKSKKLIPSESKWYENKYVHRDWYRTEDTRVSLAHQTGTLLHPDVTNDKEWLESRVFPIIKDCLEINLREERYNEILELAEYIDAYLKCLAKNGRTVHALEILEDIGENLFAVIAPTSKNELVTDEILEKLAIVERFASMPITISLGFQEHMQETDSANIEKRLLNLNWVSEVDLYKHGFPSYCLARLEWFKPRLSFEVVTEGQKITPIWYQKELLLQIETDNFTDNTNSLITKSSKIYNSWSSKAKDAKHPWLVGAIVSREWEFWHKVDNQIGMWPKKWSNMSDEKKIDGLPWSNFEYGKLKEASNSRQSQLLKLMSTQNFNVSTS